VKALVFIGKIKTLDAELARVWAREMGR